MKPLSIKSKKKPEQIVQEAIVKYLRYREWLVKRMVGNAYQSGFPDLFCTHAKYGIRLVEVKDPLRKGNVFTPAQLEWFPKFCANGAGVWVLTGATEREYKKLWQPPNWYTYLQAFKDPNYRGGV